MKISGIPNNVNINYPKTAREKPDSGRAQINEYNPVYYRPVFTSSTKDKFAYLFQKGLKTDLNEAELLQLSDYLYEIKEDVVFDPDSCLGEGTFGSVFRINDDYVLKVDNVSGYGERCEFKYPKTRNFDNVPCYYGEVIGSCDNMSILKNADPHGNAIVAGKPAWMGLDERNEYLIDVSLPAFAKLPQSSYDNYAKVINFLNENPVDIEGVKIIHAPDVFNTNNFMIVDNEIRIVDDFYQLPPNKKNDLYTICASFLDGGMTLANPVKNAKTIDNKRKIFKKCIMASEEVGIPMPCSIENMENLKDLMRVCKYSMADSTEFLNYMDDLRRHESDKEVRKQMLSEYLEELEKGEINKAVNG